MSDAGGPRQGVKQLRSVRKGCIQPRQNVPTILNANRSLPGPRPALANTARNIKRKLQGADKREKRAGIVECIWNTSSLGGRRGANHPHACCKNSRGECAGLHTWLDEAAGDTDAINQGDVAAVIGRMRRYTASLDVEATRAFLVQYTYYAGYDQAGELGQGQLRRGQHLYDFYLPRLESMKRALDMAECSQSILPEPNFTTLRRVCAKWFFFVLGKPNDVVYDQTLRAAVFSNGPYAAARDLDVGIPVQRDLHASLCRKKPLTYSVVHFLRGFHDISEHLPNAAKGGRPVCVLPCRTQQAAHQLYVFQMETDLGATWAELQKAELYSADLKPQEYVKAKHLLEEQGGGDTPAERKENTRKEEEEEDRLMDLFSQQKRRTKQRRRVERQAAWNASQANKEAKSVAKKAKAAAAAIEDNEGNEDNEEEEESTETGAEESGAEPAAPQRKKAKLRRRRARKRPPTRSSQHPSDLKKYRYGNKLCGLKHSTRPEFKEVAKYAWFCKVWCKEPELSHVICRSYLPFAKCTICVRQRVLTGLKRTQEERDQDVGNIVEHLQKVGKEKLCYYNHRSKARQSPKRYMSMIIDGADQSKYDLPYWCEKSHASDETRRLKMHLYGVLCHGRRAYAFAIPDHEEQGNNTTIQCIWRVIVDQYFEGGQKLPSVLFLQLDNTTKQNKGRYVLAFLALLVEHGIFERIYVCFLPVGHTHEDIDQMFSRMAIALRGRDMMSREEMTRVMENAYRFEGLPPKVEHWDRIGNIRDWIHRYIVCPRGIMGFRHYRISRSEKNKVMIQCRKVMALDDENWRGIEEHTNRTFLFKTHYGMPNLNAAVENEEMPDSIKRNTTKKEIYEMRKAMRKLARALPSFSKEHQEDYEAIVKLFEGPPLKFNWNKRHIGIFFGKGQKGQGKNGAGVEEQQRMITGNLGQDGAVEGSIYLIRPTVKWKGAVCCVFRDM
jgi:hypothetical protein